VIELRPATADDAELLLRWRSEPSTVEASFTAAAPSADEHARWLSALLVDPGRRLWIVVDGDEAVGQVRVDPAPGGDEISVSVAEAARGRGVARAAIGAACALGGRPVVARIRPANGASISAFTAAGFVADGDQGEVVVLRWTPPPLRDPGAR